MDFDPREQIVKDVLWKKEKLGLSWVHLADLFNRSEPLYLQSNNNNIWRWGKGQSNPRADMYLKLMNLKQDELSFLK